MSDALGRLLAAADGPGAVADAFRATGGRVVWTLGWDVPRELVDAFGLHPVRLVPGDEDSSAIDALVGAETLGARGRALLAAISALPASDALLISHADAEQPQIFATLRELARCGAMTLPPIHFLDLLTIDRPATRRYNRVRIEQAIAWLAGLAGKAPALAGALTRGAAIRAALRAVLDHRRSGRLTGAEAHRVIAAAAILSPADLATSLRAADDELGARAPFTGTRVLVSGSEIELSVVVDAGESAGAFLGGDDHGWGA